MAKKPIKKEEATASPSPKPTAKTSKGYTVTFGKGVTLGKGVK